MTYNKPYSEWTDEMKKKHQKSVREWRKTKRGVLTYTYHKQKDICRRRGKEQPKYSLEQFIEWAYKNNFEKIYNGWKRSAYSHYRRPSFDRVDANRGYELDNLRVVTWYKNQKKGILERASKKSVPILKVSITGKIKKIYKSKNDAVRDNKTCYKSINNAIKNGRLLKGYFYKLNK